MKIDSEIERDVKAELGWNPDLNSTDIAISVKNGVVTLGAVARLLVGLVQRVEPTVLQICLLVNHKQVDDAAPEPGRSLKITRSRPA